jgi:Fur family transcriptional regulator, ferric uptake regulator
VCGILQELLELDLVNRLDGRDGVSRYEIADPAAPTPPLLRRSDRRDHPFHDGQLDDAIHNTAERLGVNLTSHEIIVRRTRVPRRGDQQPVESADATGQVDRR